MITTRNPSTLAIALGVAFAIGLSAHAVRAEVLSEWNGRADAIGAEKQLANVSNARGQAMMHLAVFEAVNAVERRYQPYRLDLNAPRGASKEAAAASAAYEVLFALHPDQKAALEALRASTLAAVAEGDAKAKGIDLGRQAAAGIVALRANDGIAATEAYRPHTTPGAYVPTVLPIEITGGNVTPWVMRSGSQFRPESPPSLTSDTWTRDLNEIREIGARNSAKRSAEQTDIARFWFLTGPRTYNPIVRQLVQAKRLDLVDAARLHALTAMAAHDAFVAVFDAKYAHNLWRPITAIRNADLTANPATPREASWQPLGMTPMHPEYPCAHCIVASAVSTVLQAIVGNEVDITLNSPTAPGVTRRWTRLQHYSDEVSNARIYAGFHYRFSTEVAKDMGRRIGELAASSRLQPVAALQANR
jgi:hypothetical protein